MKLDRHALNRDSTYLFVSTGLALGWLLPNHYAPWNTFHTNAWMGLGLMVMVIHGLRKQRFEVVLSWPTLLAAAVVAVPILQYGLGLIALSSQATISVLYLAGFALAFAMGDSWARISPSDPVGLVLGAAVVAGIASVGLQLYQWFGWAMDPDIGDFWIFPFVDTGRPYANLGQPNQLASLMLWSLCGIFWLHDKKWIARGWVALLAAAFLLLGVALTESRTALLTLSFFTGWYLLFGQKRLAANLKWPLIGLYLGYLTALWALPLAGQALDLNIASSLIQRSAGEVRLSLWEMALSASLHRPMLGFGWGLTHAGLLAVYPDFQQFAGSFAKQSHNIVLDLVLWAGWPTAMVITAMCAIWFLRVAKRARTPAELVVIAALFVMLVHAMLELPLHYGYFLWPTGLLAGVASATGGWRKIGRLPFKGAMSLCCALLLTSAVVVSDYFKIEAAFTQLRFHLQRIGISDEPMVADTLVLTDWPAFIEMSRTVPKAGMSGETIQQWHDLFIFNPSALPFRKYIGALVVNGRLEEAQYWEARACFILAKPKCENMIQEWANIEDDIAKR
ncbi:MAG: Wzy polymerase domain-containing protein [Hydrogenophaga sp.]|nr:Wzy polymerase domain-containing protein [Hydrogenophaga sp.]